MFHSHHELMFVINAAFRADEREPPTLSRGLQLAAVLVVPLY